MDTESRRAPASLREALFTLSSQFELAAAVRLLEHLAAPRAKVSATVNRPELLAETVRFSASTALAFSRTEIEDIEPAANGEPAQVRVSFLGLNGPSGVLPRFYSELVLQQMKRKNFALRDFLDIFNDRAIRNHLAASRKYRLPAVFDLAGRAGIDDITALLFAVVGLGTPGLRDRLEIEDRVFVSFAGLFSRTTRSAAGLAQLVRAYLGQPTEVVQMTGRWTLLDAEDRTCLPRGGRKQGNYAQLGVDAVLGKRVFDAQGRFRLNVGPLHYGAFGGLIPGDGAGAAAMRKLVDLVRTYVGPSLAFDIQLGLIARDVPQLRLGARSKRPQLGLNTWLYKKQHTTDQADVVLRVDRL